MQEIKIMESSKFLYYLIFFHFISLSSSASSSSAKNYSCLAEQSLALLAFKQNVFSISRAYDDDSLIDFLCRDQLGSGYYPKMKNWDKSIDCCTWDGVMCNQFTGDVIGLDLSCGMLEGIIHPNSTIFNLPRLQSLNLAYNDFSSSNLPHEIGKFANSLVYFNISNSLFSGPFPSELLLLSKLVSLDLSWNRFRPALKPRVFKNLLQNFTLLSDLSLGRVNLSLVLPAYLNISSALKSLDLRATRIYGKLPDNIFNLPSLEKLDLSINFDLIGSLPKVKRSISTIPLKWLSLEATGLSGNIPNSIGRLKSLNYLSLSATNVSGEIPNSIGNLLLLENLDLSDTRLSGEIPYSIDNMRLLNTVDLSMCDFTGSLPKYLGNLTHLTTLYLSQNYLSGSLPSSLFTLPSLETIFLDNNMFNGSLPPELFTLQPLKQLSVANNQLAGLIDILDQDPALPSFRQLKKLTHIDLSYNNFNGTWELDTVFSSLRNLDTLILSYSGLFVVSNSVSGYVNPYFSVLSLSSCKISTLPNSLRSMKRLSYVDLSHNQIYGSLPNWVGAMRGNELKFFDISYNFVTGLPPFEWDMLQYLILASNLIEGPFPLSVCNMSNLYILDMSNNLFSGVIPRCFGYFSSHLQIVDLANNSFHGTIPNTYEDCGQLDGIILNGNQLEGAVPSSLSKCQSLNILDLGNNDLNGTFPTWLADLPELQVLVLKSNRFQGLIESPFVVKIPFPSLKVLDLSQNFFLGNLPIKYFGNFKATQEVLEKGELEYMHMDGKYYSITIAVKGVLLPFSKVSVAYTFIDLSSNMFGSEIPDIIGDISYLKVLNLSRNDLIGEIPSTIGNLLHIESLDLSRNQLTGPIPQSLAELTFLGVLNLSQNHLAGRIPRGTQFNTFDVYSFSGNAELCGFPLPKNCENLEAPQQETDDESTESGFTWILVMKGYGFGMLFGVLMGTLILLTRKPRWYVAILIEHELRIQRGNRVRYIHIGR